VERASRLFVLASLLIAGATHMWLASGRAGLAPAFAAAFAAGLGLGRIAPDVAIVAALATTYVAPALLLAAFGASDYHTMAIWLAPLAGIAMARASWTRWHLPVPWRVPFVAWALVIAASWPIVASREIDFSLLAARTFDTMTSAYEAPPRLAAAWIAIVALTQLTGILWLDLLFARFANDVKRFEALVIRSLVASACLCAAAGVYQAVVDLQWMNLSVWSSIARAGGLMLDANTAAMTAAMWAPIAVAIGLRAGSHLWPGVALYALLAAGLWSSGSRTGLLALAIGSTGVLVAAGDRVRLSRQRIVVAGTIIGAVVVVAALTIAPRMPFGSPLRRVFDRLPRLEATDMRRFGDELWGRFGYAKAAATMTADHPISGVGVGAFHVIAPDYLYRDGRLHPVPDNAQNWWRHQIAELGLVGALPSLWISVLVVAVVWRSVLRHRASIPVVAGAVLAGVGTASLLGVPTQHPATWIAVATLLFWLIAIDHDATRARPAAAGWWIAGVLIAVVVAVGQALAARDDLRVPRRAQLSELPFSYGVTAPEGLSEFGDFRWVSGRAVAVWPIAGPWLQLTLWAPHADVATRPVGYRVLVDGREIITREVSDRSPQTYYVQAPRGERLLMLEFRASREMNPDRALQIATAWVARVPAGTPPDRTIPH
jgi:hypothetical protein